MQRFTPACRRKNYLRFCEELEEGRSLLELAMQVAKNQLAEGAAFLHEHPRTASSWQEPCVSDLAHEPGIFYVHIHQCGFGLCSRVDRVPHRKFTTFLTNMDSVVEVFADGNCTGGHVHRAIAGAEGGMRRSEHAQRYPPGLCKALAEACKTYLRNLTL